MVIHILYDRPRVGDGNDVCNKSPDDNTQQSAGRVGQIDHGATNGKMMNYGTIMIGEQRRGRVVILVLLGAVASMCLADEPRYSGRTIAEWQDLITSIDPKTERRQEIIAGLIRLTTDDSLPDHVRRRAALTLGRIGSPARAAVAVFRRLVGSKSEPLETRIWAARALALFAKDAAVATPDLIMMLHDSQIPELFRQVPLEALGMIGSSHPDAVPALISTLEEAVTGRNKIGPQFHATIIDCIALVGPDAQAAIPLLVRCLRDASLPSEIRRRAVVAIGAMRQAAMPAMRPLLESLELDASDAVRDAAAHSLAAIGPDVLPMLERYLQHPAADVRWRIATSIGAVRPRARSAQTAVLQLLRGDSDEQVRITACETLYEIRAERDEYAEPLIDLLTSSDRNIRMRAMKLLLRTGPPEPRDLAHLEALQRDSRSHVRNTVRITLDKLKTAYSEVRRPRATRRDRE